MSHDLEAELVQVAKISQQEQLPPGVYDAFVQVIRKPISFIGERILYSDAGIVRIETTRLKPWRIMDQFLPGRHFRIQGDDGIVYEFDHYSKDYDDGE